MYSRGKQGICVCGKRHTKKTIEYTVQSYPEYAYTVLTYATTGAITHTQTQGKLEIAQRAKKQLRISDLSIPGMGGGPAQSKMLRKGERGRNTEGVNGVRV